jgi:hypothetical protein
MLLPVLFGVFMANMAFDFLPHMKVLTAALLLMNLVLLAFHKRKLKDVFRQIVGKYGV